MAGFGRGEKKRNQAVTQHSEILSAPVTEGSVEAGVGGRGEGLLLQQDSDLQTHSRAGEEQQRRESQDLGQQVRFSLL